MSHCPNRSDARVKTVCSLAVRPDFGTEDGSVQIPLFSTRVAVNPHDTLRLGKSGRPRAETVLYSDWQIAVFMPDADCARVAPREKVHPGRCCESGANETRNSLDLHKPIGGASVFPRPAHQLSEPCVGAC